MISIYNKNSIILAKLPNAGLANKLLVWAHALVFANEREMELYSYGWIDFHIGPYIRREKSKRIYYNYFKSKYIINYLQLLLLLIFKQKQQFNIGLNELKPNSLIVYDKMPHWSDYFSGIRPIRDTIIKQFYNMINPLLLAKINIFNGNCIGVHIRMGDFRLLRDNEDFSKVGVVRTPLNYFIDTIIKLRIIANKNLKVIIFSDGHKFELEEILKISNCCLTESDSDIVDLCKLSKCKVIITSAGSSFSYWAAFISVSPVIIHPQHPISIRGNGFYEKYIDENDKEFINYVSSLNEC